VVTGFLFLRHVRSAEVQLGGEHVVGATVQSHVCDGVRTSPAEGLSMVQLEIVCFLAAFATLVDKGAACAVALVDCSAHRRRDVTAVPAFSWLRCGFALAFYVVRRRSFVLSRQRELLLFEGCDQEPHPFQVQLAK